MSQQPPQQHPDPGQNAPAESSLDPPDQRKIDGQLTSGAPSESGPLSSAEESHVAAAAPLEEGPVLFAPDNNTVQPSQSAGNGDATGQPHPLHPSGAEPPSCTEGGEPKQVLESPPDPLPPQETARTLDPRTEAVSQQPSKSLQPPNQAGGGESAPVPTTTAGQDGGSLGTVPTTTAGQDGGSLGTVPTTTAGQDGGSLGTVPTTTAGEDGGSLGTVPTTTAGEDGGSLGTVAGREGGPQKGIIMSYILNAVCLVMLGLVFVKQPDRKTMVHEITASVVSNDSVLGEAVLEKYLQREDVGKRMVSELIPALRVEAQKVNYTTVVYKRLEYMCLVSEKIQWKRFKRELEKKEQELEGKYKKKLKEEMEKFELNYEQKLSTTKEAMDKQMSDTKDSMENKLHTNQEQVSLTMDDRIRTMSDHLNGKMEEISTTLGLRDKLLEVQGFLKIDSIGPVLMVLGVVEALLCLCMCVLCGRSVSGTLATQPPRHHRGANADRVANGGNAVQQQQPPISTNNSNVVALCFRNADEKLSHRLGAELVGACRGLHLRSHVVNDMEDVWEIPACRAALVFVEPDEREMIIEDERYHIGQGLRRQAVQHLMDSRVEVFIIIFNDKRSATLPAVELYNKKLGQVDQHVQLKKLKRKDRVVSIKDHFHQHQTSLIVGQFNSVFGSG